MKKRAFLAAAVLMLLLSACSSHPGTDAPLLYFPSASYFSGSALATEAAALPAGVPAEQALLDALLRGPSSPELRSPFPAGVSLRSWQVTDGILHISLSEQYGGLSGISLTLADYSIALTLCQLEHIQGVSIKVANDPIPFRYRQILSPENVLLTGLSPGEAVPPA